MTTRESGTPAGARGTHACRPEFFLGPDQPDRPAHIQHLSMSSTRLERWFLPGPIASRRADGMVTPFASRE